MIEELKKKIKENGEKIVYNYENEEISYQKLYEVACEYSNYLKKQGTEPVIIIGNNDINEFIAIISCVFARRTYIPLGLCTPVKRLEKIIELTKASLIISDLKLDAPNIDYVNLKHLNQFNKLNEKESNNKVAYIIFTSGSTGEPKGVPISYDNLNNFIKWISSFDLLSKYTNINVFNQASFSFDLSVTSIYYSLFNGHKIVGCNIDLENNFNNVLEFIKCSNLMVITPTFIKMCLLDIEFNANNYSNLMCIYFCGEQLETKVVKKIFERFPNINIINAYGPTEATSAVSAILVTKDMLNDKLLPVGNIDNLATPIKIINDEIVLIGKSVSNGYINNYQGGFYDDEYNHYYKTGDNGYIFNNYLYCKGRIDNQIKYKGYRIELGEIEFYLKNNDKVVDAVVIPKYDLNNNIKFLKAFVIGKISEEEIRAYLHSVLPNYMIPKNICFVSQLPINKNGKIDRKKLMEL